MKRRDFALTPAQRADAREALAILTGSHLSLATAARIAVDRRTVADRLQVHEAVAQFIASRLKNQKRAATVQWYEQKLSAFVTTFGERWIDELERAELRRWIDARPRGSQGPAFRATRALLLWAAGKEPPLLHRSPLQGVRLEETFLEHNVGFLPVEQCAALLAGAAELQPAIALGLFAGIRPQELAGDGKPPLDWSAIHPAEKTVRVDAAVAKTRKARILEGLPETLWHWLPAAPPAAGRVCPWHSQQIPKRARRILRVKAWPYDALRHTFATYAVAHLGDATKVSLWLGHEGSPTLLHNHYRGLVTAAAAAKFWALRPPAK